MFPPVEDAVLRENPQFATFYTNLTINKLDVSGLTKEHASQQEWNVTKENLRKERLKSAKYHLLRDTICNLDMTPPLSKSSKSSSTDKLQALPIELIELTLLLSAHINAPRLESSSEALIQSTEHWQSLQYHLPQLSSLLSTHLQKRALLLARIISPSTNPSYLHRSVPKILPTIISLQSTIYVQKEELANRRNALVTSTLQILAQYQHATSLSISHLEQTIHGALSRHIKAKSEYLANQALSVSLLVDEKEIMAKKMIYTQDVQKALGNYIQHLRVEQERAREKERDSERVLWGYGVGKDDDGEKERVMREIARMYGKLKTEIRSVERDVARLKGK